ncbi:MAG: hypothetical protein ACRELY_06775 [Polyangiaceae bacterium]
MAFDVRGAALAAWGYIRKNPDELALATRNAVGLRFGVPLAALRYLAATAATGKKAPKDIALSTSPPALELGATVDAMGTTLRAQAAIRIDLVEISAEELKIGIVLSDVRLKLLADSDSPVATLVKSGALDLSKPGNLVSVLPKRPAAIVDAKDDHITVDLMKVPKIAKNKRLRKVLKVVTPLVGIRKIETDADHLYVTLRATPAGLREAIDAAKEALIE